MKKSNKLSSRLDEARDKAILFLYSQMYTAEEIGEIFSLSMSAVYKIVKTQKV